MALMRYNVWQEEHFERNQLVLSGTVGNKAAQQSTTSQEVLSELTLQSCAVLDMVTPVDKITFNVWLEEIGVRCQLVRSGTVGNRAAQQSTTSQEVLSELTLQSCAVLDMVTPVDKITFNVWLEEIGVRCQLVRRLTVKL
eukprot:scpid71934/ scgid28250/ 